MEELIEIGWTGRAHGLNGEIKLRVSEFYEDDLLAAGSVFIGDPPVPFFPEQFRGGGALIAKFEGFDTRESITLLSNKPLFLSARNVTAREPEEETPFHFLIGFSIEAPDYPRLGPITEIMDLPDHYLASFEHEGRELLIPLHEELIESVNETERVVRMNLPQGLLSLHEEE